MHCLKLSFLLSFILIFIHQPLLASQLPFEESGYNLIEMATGPVAKIISILAIIFIGIGYAVSDGNAPVRKGLGVLFGIAVAANALLISQLIFGW